MKTLKNRKVIDGVMHKLMDRYKKRVPDVQKICDAMVDKSIISCKDNIQNDHIAFRTMGVPNLGIKSLERVFLHHGYEKRDSYTFKNKKLNADWYSPPYSDMPRIFISELRVQDLAKETSDIIHSYTDEVKQDPTEKLDLDNVDEVDNFLHSSLWKLPTYSDYEKMKRESEYASWVIYNRYYLNHYTISVHNLKYPYNDLTTFNNFLELIGVSLNDSGGKIKVSADGLLLQSSSISKMVQAKFAEGITKEISGSYVEFAERKVLPEFKKISIDKINREHRRDGFEAGNADKIFESTYSSQTLK